MGSQGRGGGHGRTRPRGGRNKGHIGWNFQRDRHGTSMSQFSHRGWGRFPSSKMMSVSRTCLLQKYTRIAVLVPAPQLGSPLPLSLEIPSDMYVAPLPPWPRPFMPTPSPLPSRAASCGGNQVIPPPSPGHSHHTSLNLSSSPWASDRPPSLCVCMMSPTCSLACCMACTSCSLFFVDFSSVLPYQTSPLVP